MKRIPLRRRNGTVRTYALVDDEDFKRLGHLRWSLHSSGYAHRAIGKGKIELLHRAILGLAEGDPRQGDHVSGDRLDNRRANLRVVTVAEQRQNRGVNRNSRSGHRGVTPDPRNEGRWIARCQLDGRRHFLGSFPTVEDAVRAAEAFRRERMPLSRL